MGVKKYLDIWTAELCGVHKLTRQEIDRYTRKKLRETLKLALENSTFYREKFGSVGQSLAVCGNNDNRFMDAFRELPFTTAHELRTHGMDFLCVSPAQISRIVTLDTGGSTGEPKRIYFTEDDQQLTVDYFQNGMQLLTDSSDKVIIFMPAKVPGSIGKLLSQALRNFGADTVEYGLPAMRCSMSQEEIRQEAVKLLEIMEKEHITSAVALPTHMKLLTEFLSEERSTDKKFAENLGMRSILLSAEYVSDEDVTVIEKAFGCKVYEHYGMTEMGLGCAVSCGQGQGYHVRECDLYLEIIDPDTAKPLEDGAFGEIVFTTLTRRGMPFIRYRTGDYSRWLTEECACGSLLKRLDKVGPREYIKGYLK